MISEYFNNSLNHLICFFKFTIIHFVSSVERTITTTAAMNVELFVAFSEHLQSTVLNH